MHVVVGSSTKFSARTARTGSSKGVKLMAQQWKGSRLKGALLLSLLPPHSVFHSVAVMYPRSFFTLFLPMVLAV